MPVLVKLRAASPGACVTKSAVVQVFERPHSMEGKLEAEYRAYIAQWTRRAGSSSGTKSHDLNHPPSSFLSLPNWFGISLRLPALLTSMVIDISGRQVK